MTKKQYQESKKVYEKLIKEYQDNMDIIMFNEALNGEKIGDLWNFLHDEKRELEDKLHDLDMDWEKRNWTTQDHMDNDLVLKNID